MQERKRDVFNTAERRGGTLLSDEDEMDHKCPDWKQTRLVIGCSTSGLKTVINCSQVQATFYSKTS